MTTNSTTNIAQQHPNINPSEVGWQFVPQYYNFVNKEPHRLHCFYTKESTLIHGTEGEQDKPCFGQQEIHNKITAIGFQDCRVFIHSVDAQSSANGGIIIQVIGEMSNHNEPWRKFVQTFFLAEQPNGYFVLNDIFRYLKEETFESDDASESAGADSTSAEWSQQQQQQNAVQTAVAPEPAPVPIPVAEPTPVEPTREPTPPPAAPVVEPTPVPAAPADEAPTTDVTEPTAPAAVEPAKPATPAPPTPVAAPAQVNGVHHEEKPKSVAPSPAPVPNVNLPPTTATPPAPTPAAAPAAEKPSAPPVSAAPSTTSQPPAAAAAAPQQAPAPPAAPQPTQPPAPKTWASLAASNKNKWGNAVAQDSRGTSEILSGSSPAPTSGQQTPVAPHGHAHPARGKPAAGENHHLHVAATQVSTAQCFIKGVTEAVTEPLLAAALSKFGALKGKPDVVHPKVCAFVEFANVESAKRAIIASLNTSAGGEGGVWIDVSSNPNAASAGGATDPARPGQIRVFVETKKERGDRPVNRRGGAPQGQQQQQQGAQQGQANGDGHHRSASGFRGRGQGAGRGRGKA